MLPSLLSYPLNILFEIISKDDFNKLPYNYVYKFKILIRFLSRKCGYTGIEIIEDKYEKNMNDVYIVEKYNLSNIDTIPLFVDECIKILKRYKSIILQPLDIADTIDDGSCSCELHLLGIDSEFIKSLAQHGYYSPVQLIDSDDMIFSTCSNIPNFKDKFEKALTIIEKSGWIDVSSKYVLNKPEPIKHASTNSTALNSLIPYIDKIISIDEFRDIINPVLQLYKLNPMKDYISSNIKTVLFNIGLVVDKHKGCVAIKKGDNRNMKTKKKSNSEYIASHREYYPYGLLYGAFSPNEQNKFIINYDQRTINIIDKYSSIDKNALIIRSIYRDHMSYGDIPFNYEIPVFNESIKDTMLKNVYKLINSEKDYISGMSDKMKFVEIPEDADFNSLSDKSLSILNCIEVYKPSDLNKFNNTEELIQAIIDYKAIPFSGVSELALNTIGEYDEAMTRFFVNEVNILIGDLKKWNYTKFELEYLHHFTSSLIEKSAIVTDSKFDQFDSEFKSLESEQHKADDREIEQMEEDDAEERFNAYVNNSNKSVKKRGGYKSRVDHDKEQTAVEFIRHNYTDNHIKYSKSEFEKIWDDFNTIRCRPIVTRSAFKTLLKKYGIILTVFRYENTCLFSSINNERDVMESNPVEGAIDVHIIEESSSSNNPNETATEPNSNSDFDIKDIDKSEPDNTNDTEEHSIEHNDFNYSLSSISTTLTRTISLICPTCSQKNTLVQSIECVDNDDMINDFMKKSIHGKCRCSSCLSEINY